MRRLVSLTLALVFLTAASTAAQDLKVLYAFPRATSGPGEYGNLTQMRGGYVAGVTYDYWTHDGGTVFRLTTGGSFKLLHAFSDSTGRQPSASLILATDGQLYGTVPAGGAYGYGDVFRIDPSGNVTVVYSFTNGSDGASPSSGVVESFAGSFVGTAGSQVGAGEVFMVSKYGDFKLLHRFSGPDGAYPRKALIQGTDYWFYGTTNIGGAHGLGTIYRVNSRGDFQLLFSFDGTHGSHPESGLMQASDGNFYGTAWQGGQYEHGAIYQMNAAHQVKVIHNFMGTDGSAPGGDLMQATDGNLYGTTQYGGGYDYGVLFRISLNGTFAVLHTFDGTDGEFPASKLLQHTNGMLYGFAFQGGPGEGGTFYRFDAKLKPCVHYLPVYGRAGDVVQILGQGFTADSLVYFNGVRATANAVFPTYLRAYVPGGATTGYITVTTATGTLKSDKVFVVRP